VSNKWVLSLSKNSQWNVWNSQLNGKTVPDARSLNGEAAVAIFRPRSGNDQLSRLCRTQVTTTSTHWRRLTVRLQILWSRTMLTLVRQNCCLENDPWYVVSKARFTRDCFLCVCNMTCSIWLVWEWISTLLTNVWRQLMKKNVNLCKKEMRYALHRVLLGVNFLLYYWSIVSSTQLIRWKGVYKRCMLSVR